MGKIRFRLAVITAALLLAASCSKDNFALTQDYEMHDVKNSPNITWLSINENGVSGYQAAQMIATDKVMATKFIVIVHPDSVNSVGMIRYTAPTAEVFRNKLQSAGNQAKQPEIFVTNDESAFKEWHSKKVNDGMVVISFIDADGYYRGYAYTAEEWEEITNPSPTPNLIGDNGEN